MLLKCKKSMVLFLLILIPFFTYAQEVFPDAGELMKRVDLNQSFKTVEYIGRMEITIGGELRVKTMSAYAVGKDKAFVEFTNPEDFGVRILKLEKNLWMYFPTEQDTVKLSGHLLKEGMMGSDVSYEDALESDSLFDLYSGKTVGQEVFEGRNCWVVELVSKSPKAPYDRRVLQIDTERYVVLHSELYAKSGKMLKESRTLEVININGRWFPSKVEMINKLRKDTKTVFLMSNLKLDQPVDEKRFTMAALTK